MYYLLSIYIIKIFPDCINPDFDWSTSLLSVLLSPSKLFGKIYQVNNSAKLAKPAVMSTLWEKKNWRKKEKKKLWLTEVPLIVSFEFFKQPLTYLFLPLHSWDIEIWRQKFHWCRICWIVSRTYQKICPWFYTHLCKKK